MFLRNKNRGALIIHDLYLAFNLLAISNENIHSDNKIILIDTAFDCSNRHLIERLRRLIVVSTYRSIRVFEKDMKKQEELIDIEKQTNTESDPSIKIRHRETIERKLKGIEKMQKTLELINKDLRDQEETLVIDSFMRELNTIINQYINTIAEFKEFGHRLSYVGQMDYALTCFEKIARTSLHCILEELQDVNDPSKRTRLIYSIAGDDMNAKDCMGNNTETEDFISKLNGKLIIENLSAIFIEIIHHLLFRDDFGDRTRNIEFKELNDRLTEERIRSILSLDGPARTKRALQLILQTVFLY
ncbi:hypothetical protein MBAV_003423 [Candidatus Magnetobacterium bavaricum]|uniref:Uncharacterized protein n=1 Tax=Candidatus Magnetobacterium bavaricum TaxID=29290 RepID=A0A0F3GUN0_9BACT|nr:hypothetical protein MBAV_003423 [Candidatus Magnetobacterium bavaricum]